MGLQSDDFPAASAVGAANGQMRFQFIFSKSCSVKVNNPVQVEAYHYPVTYGPTPPSFARAAFFEQTLYISGTASIRGHQTIYPLDLFGQLQSTFENLEIIIKQAQRKSNKTFRMLDSKWRIYVRDYPNLSEEVQQALHQKIEQRLGLDSEFVQADICRSELLIEIEGISYGV